MTPEDEFKKFAAETEKIFLRLKSEFAALRTNRPTPALVEDISVESYGTKMKIKELAAILVQPPSSLVIQPWDKANLQPIERALSNADIGAAPIAETDGVRISLPPLTEERRKELVKILGKKAEEARIAFRGVRDETRKTVSRLAAEKQISEDEKFRSNERIEKESAAFSAKIEALVAEKTKELITV